MTDETVIRTAPPDGWWRIANADEIPSPALLIYPDRVEHNVRLMVRLAGGARPAPTSGAAGRST